MREIIPLSKRRIDWLNLLFFFVNVIFVTYMIDSVRLEPALGRAA